MSSAPMEFIVGETDTGARLDVVIARRAGISRTLAVRLIVDGAVSYHTAERPGREKPGTKSLRLEPGMTVRALVPEQVAAGLPEGEDIPIRTVYEDEWLMVVAKPAGLVVHPAPGHSGGTLVNALLARTDDEPAGGDPERPGIVHRLDAGTSGLMIVAKHADAYAALTEALAAREVTRIYTALVLGVPDTDTATIDAPIGRSARQRMMMAVVAGGRESVTEFAVLERLARTTLLEVRPRTGRTHQIRVHLAAAGYPVAGDPQYGTDKGAATELGLERPFLHAARLQFAHPITHERLDLSEPLPADLTAALARARAM